MKDGKSGKLSPSGFSIFASTFDPPLLDPELELEVELDPELLEDVLLDPDPEDELLLEPELVLLVELLLELELPPAATLNDGTLKIFDSY